MKVSVSSGYKPLRSEKVTYSLRKLLESTQDFFLDGIW